MKVFRSFGKEKLILFNRKILARGKAYGLYGYSLPGLRQAPRRSAAEKPEAKSIRDKDCFPGKENGKSIYMVCWK
jgi:hypothetical protein